GDPTVAFHVDGIYRGRQTGPQSVFYDLERVEVLRGPQGTLYGRNATAGSINVITAKPNKRELGGYLEAIGGNFSRRGAFGAVNLPLVTDQLAVRVAFMRDKADGYFDNGPNVDPSNDRDDSGLRVHALYTPTDHVSLLLSGDVSKRGGVGTGSYS